jgi:heme A synthase
MTAIRRMAWLALGLGFGQIVFGAIVRITGSGMGCGEHWPRCQGHWFPPLDRPDLIIEVSHRYIAAALSVAILALLAVAIRRRHEPGVRGAGGVLRPVGLASALVLTAAIFGAVTVFLALENKAVIVTHLAIAMSLLATLVVAVVRAGGPPRIPLYSPSFAAPSPNPRFAHPSDAPVEGSAWNGTSRRTARAAAAAAALAFVALVLGALTANVPGANSSCTGFPLCTGGVIPSDPSQYLQFAHRLLAYSLTAMLIAMSFTVARRGERAAARWVRASLGVVGVQIVVAATMVLGSLPPVWRSLHEAVGTLAWVVLFFLAYVTRRAAPATEQVLTQTDGKVSPLGTAGARA